MSNIIGLMGYAQSGKDTVAQTLVAEYGFERIAFADALRDCLYALNPTVLVWHGPSEYMENAEETDVQTMVDADGWDAAKQDPEVRALLQRMGTEVGREILGQNIWVDTAMKKASRKFVGEPWPGGRYVFTDVRFPNEARAILRDGGELWRIKRPGTEPVNAHPSETALDDQEAHVTIFNEGTLDELRAQVVDIMHARGVR